MRVRTPVAATGKVEWVPNGAADLSNVKSAPLTVSAGDWQEIAADLAESGPIGTLRFYLPATAPPIELDWVELRGKDASTKPMRWDFNSK